MHSESRPATEVIMTKRLLCVVVADSGRSGHLPSERIMATGVPEFREVAWCAWMEKLRTQKLKSRVSTIERKRFCRINPPSRRYLLS
ncbi:hypothetical protein, partial [Bathymodiolus platifrons methanotrophic gill symbiont]|uniref:hypothetical protein n=1 Tax=Bathymodiolus platifrons methanotrophic gill symbiont TaxID=113268 RepID=UPI001124F547